MLGTLLQNRYRIDSELGRGGMGEVYRATDTQTGELVAVKVLNPEVVAHAPDLVERFVREGEALRQLNHPNIVRMIAAVQEQGQHYLIVEYVSGGSLADVLVAQGRLPSGRVIELALDLADALTRAHRLGIIHRDLKPANVLLAEDGTPRLADFGIAYIADTPHLTQTGVLVGTVDYLCPEACNGEKLDERADIWSFGVMLFEMLTGSLPFTGASLTSKLTAILTRPIPDLTQYAPDVPDALADLVYRMLEKDHQQRIPSIRLVGAELEALLKGWQVVTPSHPVSIESRFETPTPSPQKAKHNLPTQATAFIGRQAELTELARLLNDPAVRLVTILGVGGMGKTRLSLETGTAQLNHYPNGVYFVPLAPLDSTEAIVPATAQALGFSFYEGGEPRQQLLDYLREKSMLLILDNFEHLLSGAGLVTEILQIAPRVKILCTTRARMDIPGEQLFHLEGMEFPEWETPADAMEYSAVKLFLQSARRVRPGFELVADDLKYVARICRVVGGMPLGILLAAAWVEMLTSQEIADEMQRSLDFLETGQQSIPKRQRSMRAVFDYAWNSLTEHEQKTFRAISVFRGGFTREAAQEVTQASLRELMGLVNKSLLHRSPAGRYEIHELLRQYGAEKLAEIPDEAEVVRNRHSAYFADYLQRRESALSGKGQKQALIDIAIEIENVRAGWDWATLQGRVEDIHRSLESLVEFHDMRSEFKEAETLLSTAAERLEKHLEISQEPFTRLLLARIQTRQGGFLRSLGDLHKGEALIRAALSVFEAPDAQRDEAYALYFLAWNTYRWREQRAYFERALTIFQQIGDRKGEALCLDGLSEVTFSTSEFEMNIQLCQESLKIFQELGNDRWTAKLLDYLGYAYWLVGDYETAQKYHQESPSIHKGIGDRHAEAAALNLLAIDLAAQNKSEQAIRLLQEALAIYKEIGAVLNVCVALTNLAEFFNFMGDFTNAVSYARESFLYAQNNPKYLSWPNRTLGEAMVGLDDPQGAREHLRKSLKISQTLQEKMDVLLAIKAISAYFAAKGDGAKALELTTLINHHPATSQWTKDRASELAVRLESDLPPDVVAAAKERGRACDLDATVAELLAELGEGA